jgi:signal transduction histidine kinase
MTGAVLPDPAGESGLPAPEAVWAEAHAALLDDLSRHEPAHALRRLARSTAHLMGCGCRIATLQGTSVSPLVFQGGADLPDPSTDGVHGCWHWPLTHGGVPVGELTLATGPGRVGRDALAQRLQPVLDTAAALLAAVLEHQGRAQPASLSLARAAMREAGTFVWEWDIVTDALGDIDEGAVMLGYAPHDIGHTQSDWNQLIHPEDVAAVEAAYQAHANDSRQLYRAVYRARAADGCWRWIEERGRVVARDADGRPLRMFGTQTDATVQHALEQARRDHLAAEAANVAKTQFLSRVSHELRTPLNAVLGFAQLLDLDQASALSDTQRRRVALIRHAGDYLLAMIGDLLDLSLVESGHLPMQVDSLPLAPLVHDALDLVRGEAEAAHITLHIEPIAADLAVRADAMRLTQVLINLLTNGVKYNRPGGEVRVSARREPDGRCLVQVSDSGIGIPANQRDGLFQPFNRLGRESSKVQGSGLGLALSQALVTLMGGQLSLCASSAAGSCFGVWLQISTG